MIKVTKLAISSHSLMANKTIYLNAHKIKCIFSDLEGDTYIEFNVGGLHVEESLEDVLQQINKVLNGGMK